VTWLFVAVAPASLPSSRLRVVTEMIRFQRSGTVVSVSKKTRNTPTANHAQQWLNCRKISGGPNAESTRTEELIWGWNFRTSSRSRDMWVQFFLIWPWPLDLERNQFIFGLSYIINQCLAKIRPLVCEITNFSGSTPGRTHTRRHASTHALTDEQPENIMPPTQQKSNNGKVWCRLVNIYAQM